MVYALVLEEGGSHAECGIDVDATIIEIRKLLKAVLKESYVHAKLVHLVSLCFDLLLVDDHESVWVDNLFNLYFVERFLSPAFLETQSVHLERENARKLFYPIDLLSPRRLSFFNLILINRSGGLPIPDSVELFLNTLCNVKDDI